jgi:hypothetical protein
MTGKAKIMKINSHLVLGTAMAMVIASSAIAEPNFDNYLGTDALRSANEYERPSLRGDSPTIRVAEQGRERRARSSRQGRPAARTQAPAARVADSRRDRRGSGVRQRDRRHDLNKHGRNKHRHGSRAHRRSHAPAHRRGHVRNDNHNPFYYALRTIPYLLFHSHYDAPYYGYNHYSGPRRPILTHRSVRRILRDHRFRHINRIRRHDGYYVARALNHRGYWVRVRLDAYSGDILRVRFAG